MSDLLVKSLWIGPKLGVLHAECLQSFLTCGYSFELYCYDEIEGIPKGVVLKDASNMFSRDQIFSYKKGPGKGSFSAFSNVFRYALLNQLGGTWVDTDVFCLKPLELENTPYLFSTETTESEKDRITASCIIKTPPGAPIMKYCLERSLGVSRESLEWGQIGPRLLTEAVKVFKLENNLRPSWEFCSIGWDEVQLVTDSSSVWRPPQRAKAVHMNHEILRRAEQQNNFGIIDRMRSWIERA